MKPNDDPGLDPFGAADADEAQMKAAEQREMQRVALDNMVCARLRRAVEARRNSGIEDIWREDDDQYNGIDRDEPAANIAPVRAGKRSNAGAPAKRSRLVINITKPKTDAAVARVQELLVPNDDKPWEIGPTPVPELAKAADGQDPRELELADGTKAPAQEVAKALMAKAEQSAKLMSDHIEDWFVEGRVYKEMRRVIHDAGRIGTGVLKGPFPVARQDRRWMRGPNGMAVQIKERIAPTSKAISAWNLFPDPACGEDLHAGAFCGELEYLAGRSVREMAALPDVDTEALAAVLMEGPKTGVSQYDDRYTREKPGQVQTADSDTFEVYHYYGDITPDTLVAGGWVVMGLINGYESDDEEEAASYQKQIDAALQLYSVPVVVTTINGRCVRITMAPNEAGDFPFDVFPWEPVEGQLWGRGVPRKMAPASKMLQGASRSMLENAGMSAGPQIVIDKTRITPANGQWEITGRKLWYWEPGDEVKDVRFAFQSVEITSAQQQLQGIIKYALEMADILTNLPMMLQGDMGAAPDTVGGMAMLEANATSPLRAIAQAFDDHIVVPHLSRYYDWAMQDENVPEEAKGDLQCRARGASALVLRDIYAQVLPQLMPFVKDPDFELDPKKYIEQLLRSNKLNPTSLSLTQEQVQARAEQAAANPPVDPKVQAAQITAEQRGQALQAELADRQQAREIELQESQLDRALEQYVKEIEFQIQAMEFANRKEISLEDLRAMLAAKAIDAKTKRDLFVAERALKMDPSNPTNQGV